MDPRDRPVDRRPQAGPRRDGVGARDPRNARDARDQRELRLARDRGATRPPGVRRDPRGTRDERFASADASGGDPAFAPDDPVWDGEQWVTVDPRTGRPYRTDVDDPAPRGPLLTPLRVTLAIGLVIGIALMAYAMVVQRGQDVPLLAAAAFVLGVVCAAYGVTGAIATYRAAADGRGGRAFGLALLGGAFAIAAFGFLAMATIFGLLWRAPVI